MDLDAIDPSGNYYFYSAALESTRLVQKQDVLSDLIDSLEKPENPWHGANPKFALNLSILSRAHRERKLNRRLSLSAGRLQKLASGLSQNYIFTDLISEPFSDSIQNFLYLSVAETRKPLSMIAVAPAFGNYLLNYAAVDKKFTRAPDRFITDDSSGSVGLGDLLFAFGKTIDKPIWAGSENSNLLLYRAAQYSPEGYWINTFREGLGNDLLAFCCPKVEAPKKPLANLVFSSSRDPEFDLVDFSAPITNALLASGYEIQITFDEILPKADLFYIVGNEDWLSNSPLFDRIVRLLDHQKSRFYGPVILHPLGEIKNRFQWKAVRAAFHIPATETGWVRDLPVIAANDGRRVRWRGDRAGMGAGMSFIRAEALRHKGGEAVLSELIETHTLALILKSGTRYLVNGNVLHLESAFFLARLMGGALEEPTMAHVTAGRTRTSAFAVEDTRLKIKIPSPEPPENWRQIIFDENGKRVDDQLVPGTDRIDLNLGAGNLFILEVP